MTVRYALAAPQHSDAVPPCGGGAWSIPSSSFRSSHRTFTSQLPQQHDGGAVYGGEEVQEEHLLLVKESAADRGHEGGHPTREQGPQSSLPVDRLCGQMLLGESADRIWPREQRRRQRLEGRWRMTDAPLAYDRSAANGRVL